MIMAVAVCVSCNGHSADSDSNSKVVAGSETMELIEKVENGEHHEVWRDKQTGREYFVRINGHGGACGFELTGRESE